MLEWLHEVGKHAEYVPGKASATLIITALFCLVLCIAGPFTAIIGYGGFPWRCRQ